MYRKCSKEALTLLACSILLVKTAYSIIVNYPINKPITLTMIRQRVQNNYVTSSN